MNVVGRKPTFHGQACRLVSKGRILQFEGSSNGSSDLGTDDDFGELYGGETLSRAERAQLRSERRSVPWICPAATAILPTRIDCSITSHFK